jgi:dolichyl-phosphate-mannose--protein O-mannosyl transferase
LNKFRQPIKCGESFRLFHLATKRNLHSHLFQSPLSNNQEVSAFGENGEGDDGDNWVIDCEDDFWRRDEPVRIKHELTNKYLHITGDTYGRPINGQFEVSCFPYANQLNLWKVMEGIYIKPSSDQSINNEYNHTEL